MTTSDCPMCRGAAADEELERIEAWQDAHWRLTVSLSSEVAGFAYLEPKRHIRYIATSATSQNSMGRKRPRSDRPWHAARKR